MNKDIDDTIKEITLSIIQFDTDIKTGNSDGISTFLKIIPVLKRYSSLMVPDKYEEKIHFLNFKNEILDLFDYLFIESNIYKVAEGLFKQNGDVKIQGNVPVLKFSPLVSEIEAIRRNENPLNTIPDNRPGALKKAIGINHFEAFISKYQGLYNINEIEKKYPDKFYAWYHKILIAKGKAEQFTPGAKQEIIDYGKNRYGTKGHGFYQAFMEFDLTSRSPFVNSLSSKDKKAWKGIIIAISNNDIDVINYLKDFPN